VEGMVVGLFPGGAMVRVGDEVLLCQIAKTFRAPQGVTPLAVGDDVTVALTQSAHQTGDLEADRDRSDGMVLQRQLRRTVLSRPQPRSGKRRDEYGTETFEKVIAANMDVLLIVAATCQPALRRGLIDRYLIVAERGELAPVLVVNKIDITRPNEAMLGDFASLGLDIVLCSAMRGDGLSDLRERMAGKRSILAGASGVGKSTLINALIPAAHAATCEVRASDERGRHTTSAASVYDLSDGGILVDTPGIRELGLRFDAQLLPWYFPEFDPHAAECRFNDCSHTHEPHCAVIAAVDAGQIPPRRYDGYLRLLETLEED
jgi:ribosome biogenesis GTPase